VPFQVVIAHIVYFHHSRGGKVPPRVIIESAAGGGGDAAELLTRLTKMTMVSSPSIGHNNAGASGDVCLVVVRSGLLWRGDT
jgi:hypothetical protein